MVRSSVMRIKRFGGIMVQRKDFLPLLLVAVALLLALPETGRAACQTTSVPVVSTQTKGSDRFFGGVYSWLSPPTVTLTVSDPDGCGEIKIWYKLDANTYIGSTNNPLALVIPYGVHTLSYYATDAAGHASTEKTLSFVVDDGNKPNAVAVVRSDGKGTNDWYTSTPTVTLTAEDGSKSSGIKALLYKMDFEDYRQYTGPFTIPDGVHTVFYRADDNAGQVHDYVLNLKVDRESPTLTIVSPVPRTTSASNVTVLGFASDAISGPPTVTINGVPVSVDAKSSFTAPIGLALGKNRITVVATDGAGRTRTMTKTITRTGKVLGETVNVPTISNVRGGMLDYTGWWNATRRITVTGTHFDAKTTVRIGGKAPLAVRVRSSRMLEVTVRLRNYPPGAYSLTVTNGDGQSVTKKKALVVR